MARMSGLPAAAARERTAEVLRHVGLYEERYRPIGGYSTGMKQRVKLAQALVHDPRLLLLDEPTNGLDPAGRDEMLALVRRTGTEFGIAVIVASHLLGEIERVCDFLVAIDAGQLLRAAPLGTFTERTGVLAVEVEDGAAALAAALIAAGLQARPSTAGPSLVDARRTSGRRTLVRDALAEPRTCRSSACEQRVRATACEERAPMTCPTEPVAATPGQHLRPRLPGLRRPAARTPAVAVGLLCTRPCGRRYRDRPWRSGQDRAAASCSSWPSCPAILAVGIAALAAQAGAGAALDEASPIQHDTYHEPDLDPDHAVLRRAGPRAVRARPALRRPAAVLLAGPDPRRLRAGPARRPVPGRAAHLDRAPAHPVRSGRVLAAPDPVAGSGRRARRRCRAILAVSIISSALLAGVSGVIAAWTPRRAYATAAIIAVFIIPPIIVGILAELAVGDLARILVLAQPGRHPRRHERRDLRRVLAEPDVIAADLPGWLYVAAAGVGTLGCVLLVLRRYLGIADERSAAAGRAGRAPDAGGATDAGRAPTPAAAAPPERPVAAIDLDHVSRWYGNVVAVNDISFALGPGVTGLLGPNGAGKSTLLHLLAGLLAPSAGTVRIAGRTAYGDPTVYRDVGLVPEREAVPGFLTGREFVRLNADLQGVPDAAAATERAIATVDLTEAADRPIRTYSKGMRQRAKLAAALVHEPRILLLDEPFNGMDPRQRLHMMALLREMAAQGRVDPVLLAHPRGGRAPRRRRPRRVCRAAWPRRATSAPSAA